MIQNASSPASTGPAGSHFEGQVGAYYLLALLTRSEPRGLPDTVIDAIELQRAADGRPLDDVIVRAHDVAGNPVVLEIQVKRSISFAPSDAVFRKVVRQIADASQSDDFWTMRYELAIATAHISRKIAGPYQDVLTWARQINDAGTFSDRIARHGSAHEDMRRFVATFRSHLRDSRVPHDDEAVWKLLRRLQILTFDFTAEGSASEVLARARATAALHPDDARHAGNLWAALVELSIAAAASGGDRSREALVNDPKLRSFRFADDRRFANVRSVLAEASSATLGDIGNRIGDVMLTRPERVAAVHAALEMGRYVEIRGDVGVGKSGLLKHTAQQLSREATVLVLAPGRSVPNGWIAMRAILGFDGTACDLLTDLAGNGGATLFLDGLDFFSDAERKTAIDLVRAGEDVPGFAIVATMRRNFGIDEPSWLPADVLDSLGRAEPIIIGELSDAEVEEIRHAAPQLAPILSDTHPARPVVRNPFRLARIAAQKTGEPTPRTEVEMAEQWWRRADGPSDGRRARARLLKGLAVQAMAGDEPLDASDHPPEAVDALRASETLRDFGGDRVAFYHDALREWAIANLLHSEPARLNDLVLEQPASAALGRGVELAARMALENERDHVSWEVLLRQLSDASIHSSWRRSVLLAIVRSEMGAELLDRAAEPLLANDAKLLCELIRLVLAVDVQPATKVFAAHGVDPGTIPANLEIPIGPTWPRLIGWLLRLGDNVPPPALPSVIALYLTWSSGMLGRDPLTPLLTTWFYYWLRQIEANRDLESWRDRRPLFTDALDHRQARAMESELRSGFLLFCDRTPDLAAQYLNALGHRRHNERILSDIVKFRGRLAAAAPAELARLIGTALIEEQDEDDDIRYRGHRDGPFTFLDHEFFPASPAQGPFLELLTEAPDHGLSLIRRLIDHAIDYFGGDLRSAGHSITISLPGGDRVFSWTQSFAWSRGNVNCNCVPSALMALEAWGHRRIEAGETVEAVLGDVIGPLNSHAAYLLVAIDLILSHWPESRTAAVPYLACPELLCFDRERQIHDTIDVKSLLGVDAHTKEPPGCVSLEQLNQYPSRRLSLDQLLGQYAVSDQPDLRETLRDLLTEAAEGLGPPSNDATFDDPAFMAVYALNVLNPKNWEEATVERSDGKKQVIHRYVSPESERRHLARLERLSGKGLRHSNMQVAIGNALDDPARSSPEFAATIIEWAQGEPPTSHPGEGGERWMQEQAVFGAAMIAMRDGSDELRGLHTDWAREVLAEALQVKDDPVYAVRSGLRYNPIAIAFAGLIFALRDRSDAVAIRQILDVAARDSSAAAHGLGAAMATLVEIDSRLPRSILRCAFAACIRPERAWNSPDEETARRAEHARTRVAATVEGEMAWLMQGGVEPDWPAFPTRRARRRRGIRLPGGSRPDETAGDREEAPADEYVSTQAAAIWLSNSMRAIDAATQPWLLTVVQRYADWTAMANGAGLDAGVDIRDAPGEWNRTYYDLVARCLPGLPAQQVRAIALARIGALPDQSFFDVVSSFLRSVDEVFFSDAGLDERIAVEIRAAIGERMTASGGWRRLLGKRDTSIEMHIGPAIAVLFFNTFGFTLPARCYLFPKGIDRVARFLPVLETLAKTGASIFVASLTLNLLEVDKRPDHLSFFLSVANEWLYVYPDDTEFWIEQGIGQRVCGWLEAVHQKEPGLFKVGESARTDADRVLAALVQMGLGYARRLEEMLAESPTDTGHGGH